uniref:Reverse transcriptase domain-containing protein n=1 Tax=Steinernema glaseri TaxID=37863 RepID=A0A1I7Z5D2_9BILA
MRTVQALLLLALLAAITGAELRCTGSHCDEDERNNYDDGVNAVTGTLGPLKNELPSSRVVTEKLLRSDRSTTVRPNACEKIPRGQLSRNPFIDVSRIYPNNHEPREVLRERLCMWHSAASYSLFGLIDSSCSGASGFSGPFQTSPAALTTTSIMPLDRTPVGGYAQPRQAKVNAQRRIAQIQKEQESDQPREESNISRNEDVDRSEEVIRQPSLNESANSIAINKLQADVANLTTLVKQLVTSQQAQNHDHSVISNITNGDEDSRSIRGDITRGSRRGQRPPAFYSSTPKASFSSQHSSFHRGQASNRGVTTYRAGSPPQDHIAEILRLQSDSARREELKSLEPLTGFEGQDALTDFIRGFEEIVQGCESKERIKLLRSKCKERAKRLVEDIIDDGDNSYWSIKKKLEKQALVDGLTRAKGEPLTKFSNRVAKTIRNAFPQLGRKGTEPLLQEYFLRGLQDTQLIASLASLHNLPFEEMVVQAVRIEGNLQSARSSRSRILNQPNTGSSKKAFDSQQLPVEKSSQQPTPVQAWA